MMPSEDFPILPGVKTTIGRLAGLARTGLILCALLSVAEIMFLTHDYTAIGVICGLLSSLLLNLELPILSVLILWCHEVMLPGRGYAFSRFLGGPVIIFSVSCPACTLYTVFTGTPLLINQALFPFIVCLMLEMIYLINLPNMGAATRFLKLRLGLLPFLLVLIFSLDQPSGLLFAVIGKLLLLLLLARPLRQLANIAPRVISMPEKADSAQQ